MSKVSQMLRHQTPPRYGEIKLVQLGPELWEVRADNLDRGREWVQFSGPDANGQALRFVAGRYPHLTAVEPLVASATQAGGK